MPKGVGNRRTACSIQTKQADRADENTVTLHAAGPVKARTWSTVSAGWLGAKVFTAILRLSSVGKRSAMFDEMLCVPLRLC